MLLPFLWLLYIYWCIWSWNYLFCLYLGYFILASVGVRSAATHILIYTLSEKNQQTKTENSPWPKAFSSLFGLNRVIWKDFLHFCDLFSKFLVTSYIPLSWNEIMHLVKKVVKVSFSRKEIMLSWSLPKNERRISALAYKERSNQKNKGTLLY